MLTIIIPAYNEEIMVPIASKKISSILEEEGVEYEIIFIDDGSRDNTWTQINACTKENSAVRGISFSRNFGKEAAIYAGLSQSSGDCCVVIDCDLQHPPEKIIEMYHLWQDGYEVVEGVKNSRGDESSLHKFSANMFYNIISNASGLDMKNASDFKLLDRKAINAVLACKEQNAFFRAMSTWVGFKSTSITYDVREREAGSSKWSTKSLIKYAIQNITSFTSLPLQIIFYLGAFTFIIVFVFGLITLVQKINGLAVEGFTTVILLMGFIGSVIMLSLGVIGYYLSQIYNETRNRPRFIISKKSGF